MRYFVHMTGFFLIVFSITVACSSTKDQNITKDKNATEDTANMTWQQRVINKFTFHTSRDHLEKRKLQEQYELEQYYAKKETEKQKSSEPSKE